MPLPLYGANYHLDRIYGSETPTNLYVALMTSAPSYTTTGSGLDEPSGGSYARVEVPNDTDNWHDAADGLKANGKDIVFPTATALWGNMKYWAILDASTDGNILVWGGITSKLVAEGVTPRFVRDRLSFTVR